VTRYSLHHLIDPQAALSRNGTRLRSGRANRRSTPMPPEDPPQAAAYHRVETLRDPSHARALSLTELRELFPRAGLSKPEVTLYELSVELQELLARAPAAGPTNVATGRGASRAEKRRPWSSRLPQARIRCAERDADL